MKIKKHTILCISILLLLSTLYTEDKNNTPTITINAVESSLPSILSILADESGFNIVTGPKVNSSEKITTLSLRNQEQKNHSLNYSNNYRYGDKYYFEVWTK